MNKILIVIAVMIMNAYHMWYRVGIDIQYYKFEYKHLLLHTVIVGALVYTGLSLCSWIYNTLYPKLLTIKQRRQL